MISDMELVEMERELASLTTGDWRVELGSLDTGRIDLIAEDGTVVAHTHASKPKVFMNLNWPADFKFLSKAKIIQRKLIDEIKRLQGKGVL